MIAKPVVTVVRKRLAPKVAGLAKQARDWFSVDSPRDALGKMTDTFWHARHRAFERAGWRLTPKAEKGIDRLIREGRAKPVQGAARGDTRMFDLDYEKPRRVIFNVRTRRIHTVLDPGMSGRMKL